LTTGEVERASQAPEDPEFLTKPDPINWSWTDEF